MSTIKNVNINGTVSRLSAGVYDVTEQNNGRHFANIEEVLSNNASAIPSNDRLPGMEIKFIQDEPAIYSVTKEESLEEVPEDSIEIQEPLLLNNGKYTADELAGITLPASVGSSIVYYIIFRETVEEETVTTYTSWSITFERGLYSVYNTYRLMSSSVVSGDFVNVNNWQGVDEEPISNSKNLVESNGVFSQYINIIKEMSTYIEKSNIPNKKYAILRNSQRGYFGSSSDYYHKALQVKPGQKYLFNAVSETFSVSYSQYAFVTTDESEPGGLIPTVDGVIHQVPKESSEIITVPEGCTHIIFDSGLVSQGRYARFSVYFMNVKDAGVFASGQVVYKTSILNSLSAESGKQNDLVKNAALYSAFRNISDNLSTSVISCSGNATGTYESLLKLNYAIPAGTIVRNIGTAKIRLYDRVYTESGAQALLVNTNTSYVLEFNARYVRDAGTVGTYKILAYMDSVVKDVDEAKNAVSSFDTRITDVETTQEQVSSENSKINSYIWPYTQIKDYPTGKHWITDTGSWDTANRNHASIPVTAGEVFYLAASNGVTSLRYAFVVTDNWDSGSTEIDYVDGTTFGAVGSNKTLEVTIPEGCNFLIFNVNANYMRVYQYQEWIDKRITTLENQIGSIDGNIQEEINDAISSITVKDGAVVKSADLSQSLVLDTFPNSNEFGDKITFNCRVTSFSGIAICHGYSDASTSSYQNYSKWFEIYGDTGDENSGKIILKRAVKNSEWSPSSISVRESVPHSLNITKLFAVNINNTDDGKAKVTLQTLSGSFTHTFSYTYAANGSISVKNIGSVLTDCCLSAVNPYLRSPVWVFGASFENISTSKWLGQMKEMGYFNYLANAYPGRNSQTTVADFRRALNFATPKYVYYSGSNDTTVSTYRTYLNQMDTLCKEKGITLIAGYKANNLKTDYSAWRDALVEVGCRYISMEHALIDPAKLPWEANKDCWYDGFMSSDGVHPTILGAKAIAMQACIDYPELMWDCRETTASVTPEDEGGEDHTDPT